MHNICNKISTRKMASHPDKCNIRSITRNKNPYYTLHGHPPLEESKYMYIGLIIAQDLKLKSHDNNVCTGSIKRLAFYVETY